MGVVSGHVRVSVLLHARRVSNASGFRVSRYGLGSTSRVHVLTSHDRALLDHLLRRRVLSMRRGHVNDSIKAPSPSPGLVGLEGPMSI